MLSSVFIIKNSMYAGNDISVNVESAVYSSNPSVDCSSAILEPVTTISLLTICAFNKIVIFFKSLVSVNSVLIKDRFAFIFMIINLYKLYLYLLVSDYTK